MPKNLRKITKYPTVNRILRFLKSVISAEADIVDAYLFGSVVKGKRAPGDIDVLLVFLEKVNLNTTQKIRTLAKDAGLELVLLPIKYVDLFSPTFLPRADILSDAYSSKSGKKLSESFGYVSHSCFVCSFTHLTPSERVKFHYLLSGRGATRGLLAEIGAHRLSDGTFLVPVRNSEKFEQVLEYWKVPFQEIKMLAEARIENLLRKK